jgi:hypothetical protein
MRYVIVGALLAIAVIVIVVATTPGLPTWSGAAAGGVLLLYVAWTSRRTARLGARVFEVMRGKGAMTVTDVCTALGDIKRVRVIAALARLRASAKVTREEIPPDQRGDAPDTHRYTAA